MHCCHTPRLISYSSSAYPLVGTGLLDVLGALLESVLPLPLVVALALRLRVGETEALLERTGGSVPAGLVAGEVGVGVGGAAVLLPVGLVALCRCQLEPGLGY